ncbi:MAG: DUF4011 domain-containing protein [Kiritimatiellae bacterium]|nr:DUF4011 domain-containing protein [Kiritimatiellia bacterium]
MDTDFENARMTRWTQRLLDLSLRNRLLNARDCKQILPLECDGAGMLEDRLSSGATVAVESSSQTVRTGGSLRTPLGAEEAGRRLKELYRLAKTGLEESGVNALYIAVGFLNWRARTGDKTYRAPLVLVPVQLSRKNVREGYSVSRFDDDTVLNTTLVEFLRAEFGISVAGVDPLPEDASGVAVDEVMQSFREAVKAMDGWSVDGSIALGHFSFGKFVMWKDLSSRAGELAAHPLVAHLMKGGGGYDDGVETPDDDELVQSVAYDQLFCPLSADSSQLAAVLLSAKGKSFVLHGPPGTGKSQTITNLIAHNIATGRRVLFVSEKKAALDVVHRRLVSAGLGPFCLELHSNKAGKGDVLAQFAEALDYVDKGVPLEWGKTTGAMTRLRAELDAPVAALHRRQKNGLSAYDCFAAKTFGTATTFPLADRTVADWDEKDVAEARERAVQAAADWREIDASAFAALELVENFRWSPGAEADVREKLSTLRGMSTLKRGLSVLFAGKSPIARRGGIRSRFAGFAKDFPARIDAALAALGKSRGVMRYRDSSSAAAAMLGGGFAGALQSGALDGEDAGRSFDRSLAVKTLDEILSKEPALAAFSGRRQDEQVAEFDRTDDEYAALVRHVVRARVAFEMPGGRLGDCPDGCELGVLRRECRKKSRQKPVRRLLAETRGITGKLKPCFLMSPLSVAQYLPPEASFDLVVFDEASQIPVWDAIGVIARAKQCVIVGDPKQMPPTSFFQKGESADASDEEQEEDLESILDECLAAGLHSAYLSWHYRSRHESLIAFSNREYYGGRLYTFPAARITDDLGVKHVFVEGGVYDAKASRTNRVEAEALVEYVFVRLAAGDRRSMGVVTFSMAQKNLIDDLFEERRVKDQRFEDFFTGDGEEPFFVKNLENVQGDERDVILFSVGYAKGSDGKFLMNFGPLNRTGGERRLNVAVTRAKEQVVVFASCRSGEIDLSRTQAVGAKHLKAFLEYAEAGGVPSATESEHAADPFADAVAGFLSSRGYSVERGVGCSTRRIDIGVRSAEAGGRFVAAVECDGDAYAGVTAVRDRDKLRPGVLRSLGWNTVRTWSADWAFDRARAEERLVGELDAVLHSPNAGLRTEKFEPKVTFPRKKQQRAVEQARIPLESVPEEELRRAMAAVERDLGRCNSETLCRETVKRYGYKTLSPKARGILEMASSRSIREEP